MTLRAATIACAFVLGLAPSTPSSAARAPAPAAATAAFGRLLHARFGPVKGFWTCPRRQTIDARIDCLGEVHVGREWHQTSASARRRGDRVTFFRVHDAVWVRHWWPFSHWFIARSHEDVPGVVSVNSPAYDWGFLVTEVRGLHPGQHARADAYDGYGADWWTFYLFSCTAQNGTIVCVNELGDAMRYRRR
jgi:hypothetical protein